LIQKPHATYERIISYGGAQSNAMLSIACLCKAKGWTFDYYAKKLPENLRARPGGNLKLALKQGMALHEIPHESYRELVGSLHSSFPDARITLSEKQLLLPQGGADPLAKAGIDRLAEEITQWQQEKQIGRLNVVTPSGTGTTAFYLAKALRGARVYTTPLIGGREYLEAQMRRLGELPLNLSILETEKHYRFGKPYEEYLEVYRQLKEAGIVFDLLYAPKMWLLLSERLETMEGEVLYVHSGGVSGNASMLMRYREKGLAPET
jgi:1-aminocyclopropane-1-carboxylate deaminase